jgi:hypothetical protein
MTTKNRDADRIKLKALIVQMNEANNGLTGMALLARDPVNLDRYSEKFMTAYHSALDLLDKP